MRKLVSFLVSTAIAFAIGGVITWYLKDANGFKPQLQAFIEEKTGVWVDIRGDLNWELLPPLKLAAEDVHAEHEGRTWSLGRLDLRVDLKSMITERGGIDEWTIEDVTLTELTLLDAGDRLDVAELKLNDLGLDTPVALSSELTYTPAEGEPMPVTLTGDLTYASDTDAIDVTNLVFETNEADGRCDLGVTPNTSPWPELVLPDDALLPLDILRAYNAQGTCALSRLTVAEETFENVRVVIDNTDARLHLLAHAPAFFGGTGEIEADIAGNTQPVTWFLTPQLDGVDSQRLIEWLDQDMDWVAPIAYGGTFELTGNTRDELASSVTGETHFDGGQGKLNIKKIRQQLLAVATLVGEPDSIQRWPEVLDYQRFVGDWRVEREHHTLEATLDNLSLFAEGDYSIKRDDLDMVAELTFDDDPSVSSMDVNPLLVGLPIPVRCRGTLEDPTCRVDDGAARQLIASALQAKEGTELRNKLDEVIEEEVPEEYRDAARSLLDLLGRSLSNDD